MICIRTQISQLEEFYVWQKKGMGHAITEKMKYHRLVYEFLEFERIFRERDETRAGELQQITGVVLKRMAEAGWQAGIVFLPMSEAI